MSTLFETFGNSVISQNFDANSIPASNSHQIVYDSGEPSNYCKSNASTNSDLIINTDHQQFSDLDNKSMTSSLSEMDNRFDEPSNQIGHDEFLQHNMPEDNANKSNHVDLSFEERLDQLLNEIKSLLSIPKFLLLLESAPENQSRSDDSQVYQTGQTNYKSAACSNYLMKFETLLDSIKDLCLSEVQMLRTEIIRSQCHTENTTESVPQDDENTLLKSCDDETKVIETPDFSELIESSAADQEEQKLETKVERKMSTLDETLQEICSRVDECCFDYPPRSSSDNIKPLSVSQPSEEANLGDICSSSGSDSPLDINLSLSNSGPPLDTVAVAHMVRESLSVHNIGQRLFAKQVLGLSQGTVSELLSKPKAWSKLTEKGRESYRRMHIWASDPTNVLALKALTPRKGHVNFSPTISVKEDQATEEKISEILKEAKKAMASEDVNALIKSTEKLSNSAKMDSSNSFARQSDLLAQEKLPSFPTDQSQALVRQICYLQLAKLAKSAANSEAAQPYTNQMALFESLYPELKALGISSNQRMDVLCEAANAVQQAELSNCNTGPADKTKGTLLTKSLPGATQPFQHEFSKRVGLNQACQSPTQTIVECFADLNTEQVVKKVKELLTQYCISQRLFGEQVLGLSQGSVSDLLARPKPWNQLTHKGREPFIRMQLFLDDSNGVTSLIANKYVRPILCLPEDVVTTTNSTVPTVTADPTITDSCSPVSKQQASSLTTSHVVTNSSSSPQLPNVIQPSIQNNAMPSPFVPVTVPLLGVAPLGLHNIKSPNPGDKPLVNSALGEFLINLISSAAATQQNRLQQQAEQLSSTKEGVVNLPFNPIANLLSNMQIVNQQQHLSTNLPSNITSSSDKMHNTAPVKAESKPPLDSSSPKQNPPSSNTIMGQDLSQIEPIDTIEISNKVKEVLQINNLGQRLFGEAVLGLSQGSVSELLSKPKPWSQLSLKGREPYLRMKLWLEERDAPATLKKTQLDMKSSRCRSSNSKPVVVSSLPAQPQPMSNLSSASASLTPVVDMIPKIVPRTSVLTTANASVISDDIGVSKEKTTTINQKSKSGTSHDLGLNQKKPRIVFSDFQRKSLLEYYAKEPYPRIDHLEELAKRLQLPIKTVSNWFHNHRMRSKTSTTDSVSNDSSSKPSIKPTAKVSCNDQPNLEGTNENHKPVTPYDGMPELKPEKISLLCDSSIRSLDDDASSTGTPIPQAPSNRRKRANPTKLYPTLYEIKKENLESSPNKEEALSQVDTNLGIDLSNKRLCLDADANISA